MIGLLPTKVVRPMESSGMDLMHKKKRRSKEHWVRNGYRCQECVDEAQGSQRVQECVDETGVGSRWGQRIWDWKRGLGDGSDGSKMA